MAKAKDVDPLKLKRERPGRYVTADGRFAVQGATGGSWYLVHNEHQNELGLPLTVGPYATLDEAQEAVQQAATSPPPEAPMPAPPKASRAGDGRGPDAETRVRATSGKAADAAPAPEATSSGNGAARRRPAVTEPEEPAEPAWLARMQPAEEKEARRLLGLLDRLGIDDPAIARRDVEGNVPEVARTLLARRIRKTALEPWHEAELAATSTTDLPRRIRRHLRAEVDPQVEAAERLLRTADSDDLAAYAWLVAVRTASQLLEVLEAEGRTPPAPGQPGWRLVEVDSKGDSTGRIIVMDESDLLES